MDKLKMAHEYAMQHLENSGGKITMHSLCLFAWEYADAMQAEADKRNASVDSEGRIDRFTKAIKEGVSNANAEECQPDEDAPNFRHVGSWKDSLRKRPQEVK